MGDVLDTMLHYMANRPAAVASTLLTAAVCATFFVYWRRTVWLARPGSRGFRMAELDGQARPEFRFKRKLKRMGRRDAYGMLAITAIYACFAFFNLGDVRSIETFARYEEGDVISFELKGEAKASHIVMYSGIHPLRNVTFAYSEDGKDWTESELDDGAWVYGWRDVLTEETDARYFRITADDIGPYMDDEDASYLEFGEIGVFDKNGNYLECSVQDERWVALFDERDIVPEFISPMNTTYFDEFLYVRTAVELTRGMNPIEITHPPLGKTIMLAGIELFGITPFGWRFMTTLFGVMMVPLLYVFLFDLFGKGTVAFLGSAAYAFEFMHYVHTRICLIDSYASFFILLMYWLMYRWLAMEKAGRFWKSTGVLFLCGLAWGLAVSCKWTGVYGGLGLAVLWFLGMREEKRERHAGWRRYCAGTVGLCVLFFVVMPFLMYILSYGLYARAYGDGSFIGMAKAMWRNQAQMLTWHTGQTNGHIYGARWWSWLLDSRHIVYWPWLSMAESPSVAPAEHCVIECFSSPLVAWTGLLCFAGLGYETLRRRSAVGTVILTGYLSNLVPWMFIERTTFPYHYFTSLLFLCFVLAFVFDDLVTMDGPRGLAMSGMFVSYGFLLFLLFFPFLNGLRVNVDDWMNVLGWFPEWSR